MELRDRTLLENILECCDSIGVAFDEMGIDYDVFSDRLTIRAMLAFFVQQIGENANKISEEFKESHPEVEWNSIVGLRHRIVHGYKWINEDVLWDTIQNDIPELREFCAKQIGLK